MSALAQKQLIESDPKARFRNAPRKPDFTIGQDWGRHTPAEHDRWDRLFNRS
jgi:phenylalanine-4-hydroxylase